MQSVDQHIQWYQSRFEVFEKRMNGDKSTPIHALRRDAIRRFAEIGFPTTRQEDWRFTNISPITKIEFQPVYSAELNRVTRNDIRSYEVDGALKLVFVNGIFLRELSDVELFPKELLVGSLAEISTQQPDKIQSIMSYLVKGVENAFTALNTAFLWDGAYISLPHGFVMDHPIQLLFVAAQHERPFAAQPRNFIVTGDNSQIKIIETYISIGQNTYLTNTVTEIVLGENSFLEHDKLQMESIKAFHVGTTNIQMNSASRFTSTCVSLGGSLVRNNITAFLDGEGADCTLNGLSIGVGSQIIDNHTAIDHAKPHCKSYELYKSILSGTSKGIFNGKILVRKDAQKTDAKQTNKTLLLSDNATINTKPQLEIFADDVKCTHGATVGQLDEEHVFYLRTRGIGIAEAREILMYAFARDVIDRISIEPLRNLIDRVIHSRLDGRHESNI